MGRNERAHWRGMDRCLENTHDKAEERGDKKGMKEAYDRIVDHQDNLSLRDKIVYVLERD
jgi:hypothetical protein